MNRYVDEHIRFQRRPLGRRLRRALIVTFPVLFVSLFVVVPGLLVARHVPWPMGLDLGLRLGLGVPVSLAGLALYLWTIILFARAGGTQVPIAPTQGVVTTGPYAVSRNPMATSMAIMVCGAAVLLSSWAVLLGGLLVPSPYLVYIKLIEEKELAARFGPTYVAYKESTPFIVPRLWPRRPRPPAP